MDCQVMIVDDEVELRSALAMILESEGYKTDVASNGLEAFEKIKVNRPDVVISDMRMPIWDGRKLHDSLQTLSPPPIPMVFISGYVGSEELGFEKSPNFAGFIRKPFRVETILEALAPYSQGKK